MATATVVGADGTTMTITFASANYAAYAASLSNGTGYTDYSGPVDTLTTPSSIIDTMGTAADVDGDTDQQILVTASDVTLVTSGGGIIVGSDADTYVIGSGDWTLLSGGDSSVLLGSGATTDIMGANDTVTAGSGPVTTFGAAGSQINMGSGTLLDVASAGAQTVVGSAAGFATIFGMANTSLSFVGGGDNNTLIAGGGNETLDGSGSTGSNVYFGGTGDDSISGGTGNDVFVSGIGADTFTGGAGGNLFIFSDTASTSTDVITDFTSEDKIGLFGVSYVEGTNASGDLELTLSDGVKIDFTGVTSLDPSQII